MKLNAYIPWGLFILLLGIGINAGPCTKGPCPGSISLCMDPSASCCQQGGPMDSPYPAIPLVHLPPMCLPSLGMPTKGGNWDFQQAMAEAHAPPGQRVPIYTLVQSFLC